MSLSRWVIMGVAGLAIGCAAIGPGCAGGGDSSGARTDEAERADGPARVEIDHETALHLRRLADATIDTAIRAFGPGDGLPLDELGARLYRTRGCMECHGPGVPNAVGPSLVDAFGTLRPVEGRRPVLMDLDYINVALMRPDSLIAAGHPAGEMPSFEGTLYPREVLALAVYLQGMSTAPQPSRPAQADPADDPAVQPDPEPVERVESPLIPEVDAPSPRADDRPGAAREDGRPDWWFDGLRREDGRIWICAEALGSTFAGARAATIDRGMDLLADRLSLDPTQRLQDVRVQYIWVTPLPNRGGASRYAGYVMMSVIPE